MNESAAREVLLVRAVELADGADATLSASDRGHAARAAAELVRWQAADQGRRATAEEFLARRAQLLAADRLAPLDGEGGRRVHAASVVALFEAVNVRYHSPMERKGERTIPPRLSLPG